MVWVYVRARTQRDCRSRSYGLIVCASRVQPFKQNCVSVRTTIKQASVEKKLACLSTQRRALCAWQPAGLECWLHHTSDMCTYVAPPLTAAGDAAAAPPLVTSNGAVVAACRSAAGATDLQKFAAATITAAFYTQHSNRRHNLQPLLPQLHPIPLQPQPRRCCR